MVFRMPSGWLGPSLSRRFRLQKPRVTPSPSEDYPGLGSGPSVYLEEVASLLFVGSRSANHQMQCHSLWKAVPAASLALILTPTPMSGRRWIWPLRLPSGDLFDEPHSPR
jgi:hypothetical protein